MTDAYEVLGVARGASHGEIQEAFRRYVRDADAGLADGDRLREVQSAYETLSDPQRRAVYDATIGSRDQDGGLQKPLDADRIATQPAPPVPPSAQPGRHSRNPVEKLTGNMPRGWRIAIDWVVTIVGAIAIVLAIKHWVINPYRIPSSSMEPTLHCARPGSGCEARFSDRVLANRFIYRFRSPHRGEIIVFKTPPEAAVKCGSGGTFVKRLVGLPGEMVQEKSGTIFINGNRLVEPYVQKERRDTQSGKWRVPAGQYFFMGDNRVQSCDSREWGSVPRGNLIGEVFSIYWPPNRISFR